MPDYADRKSSMTVRRCRTSTSHLLRRMQRAALRDTDRVLVDSSQDKTFAGEDAIKDVSEGCFRKTMIVKQHANTQKIVEFFHNKVIHGKNGFAKVLISKN